MALLPRQIHRQTFLRTELACLSNCNNRTANRQLSEEGHIPNQTQTHSSAELWYGAQGVMTVWSPGSIEVTQEQTGWGLSSVVRDRKLRLKVEGDVCVCIWHSDSWAHGMQPILMCVHVSVSPSLCPLSLLPSACEPFSTFIRFYLSLWKTTFSNAFIVTSLCSFVIGWMIVSLSVTASRRNNRYP